MTRQIKQFRALNKWFRTPLGHSVAVEFTQELHKISSLVQGEVILQLGNCGTNSWVSSLNFLHKWIASPFSIDAFNQIECSLNQLPLTRSSVDCVLAPLTLEAFGSNHNLIDEIDRVIKPMGHIVLLCINPWSVWGSAVKCGLVNCYDDSKISLRSPITLNRIFMQRGYRQCSLSNFCYIPPINNQIILKNLSFLNEVGKMLWPYPAGLYCYVAQKFEYIEPRYGAKIVAESYLPVTEPLPIPGF